MAPTPKAPLRPLPFPLPPPIRLTLRRQQLVVAVSDSLPLEAPGFSWRGAIFFLTEPAKKAPFRGSSLGWFTSGMHIAPSLGSGVGRVLVVGCVGCSRVSATYVDACLT